MTARLIESRPPGTPLARQRWECSVCGLDFEPNFEDGAEMTIRRRIEKMKQSFKAHAAWHLEQEGGAPSIGTRVRRIFARQA